MTSTLGANDPDGASLLGASLSVTSSLGAKDSDGVSGATSLGAMVPVTSRVGTEVGSGVSGEPSLGETLPVTIRLGDGVGAILFSSFLLGDKDSDVGEALVVISKVGLNVGCEVSSLGATVGTNVALGDKVSDGSAVGDSDRVSSTEGSMVGAEVSWSVPLGDDVPPGTRDRVTLPVGVKVGSKESWSMPLGGAVPSVPLVGVAVLVGTRVSPLGTAVPNSLSVGIELPSPSPDGAIVGRVLALGPRVVVELLVGAGVSWSLVVGDRDPGESPLGATLLLTFTLGATVGAKVPWPFPLGETVTVASREGARVGTGVSRSLPLGDTVSVGGRDRVRLPEGVTVGGTESWSLRLGDVVPSLARVGITVWLGLKVPPVLVGATVPVGVIVGSGELGTNVFVGCWQLR